MKTALVLVFEQEKILLLNTNLSGKDLLLQQYLSIDFNFPNFFSSMSLEEEKKLIEQSNLIKSYLKQAKLFDSDVHIVIPDQACSLQVLNMPLVSEKEIVSVIEFQSDEFLPYPFEKASFDYQTIAVDEKNKQISVFVVASLKDIINRITEFVLDIGLFPQLIEPQSTALYRLFFEGYYKSASNLLFLINCDSQNSQLSILDTKTKQLIMTLNINLGNHFFARALQNNLNIPFVEALARFEKMSTTDPLWNSILLPLFNEYVNQVGRVLTTAQEKLGIVPQNLYFYSNSGSKLLATALKSSLVNSKTKVNELIINKQNCPNIVSTSLGGEKIDLSPLAVAIGGAI